MFENLVTSRWRCFERAWNLTGGSRLLGVGLEVHSLALLFHNSGSLKSEASHTFLLLPAPTHFLTMLCCCPISSCELRERITTLTSLVRDLVILMKAGGWSPSGCAHFRPSLHCSPGNCLCLSADHHCTHGSYQYSSHLQKQRKYQIAWCFPNFFFSDSKLGQNYQIVAPLTVLEQRLASLFGKGSHQKYL